MLIQFDFTLLQLRYIHAAMTEIPSYRPDGLTLGEMAAQIAEAEGFQSDYVQGGNEVEGARVRRRVSNEQLHDLCVDFRAQAKSRFRKDDSLGQRLNRLPVDDRTFVETMKRADLIVALWADLPQVGSPLAPFTVGQGTENVTLAEFTALRDATRALESELVASNQAFQAAEIAMRVNRARFADFVTAALEQGRSRYSKGTAERKVIDAIPKIPAAKAPGQATITALSAPTPDKIQASYTAKGATSYSISSRLAGETTWVEQVKNTKENTAEFPVAAPGMYEVKVRPRNSRGSGKESEIVSVSVPAIPSPPAPTP